MPRKQKCICCGKTYDLCIHCPTDVGYTPWRSMHCSVDHFKIFELVRDYVNGKLPKDKILEMLAKTNTEGYERFNTQTSAVLRELFKPDGEDDIINPENESSDKVLKHRKPKTQI